MEDNNQKLDDILEIVNFLKDNSVTKQELREFKQEFFEFKDEMYGFKNEMLGFKEEMIGFKGEMTEFKEETKNEFQKIREEIIEHVDAFVGLHQNLEIELSAVSHKTNRLENNVHQIAKHLQLQLD